MKPGETKLYDGPRVTCDKCPRGPNIESAARVVYTQDRRMFYLCLLHSPDTAYDAALIEDELREIVYDAEEAHDPVWASRLLHLIDVMNGEPWFTESYVGESHMGGYPE